MYNEIKSKQSTMSKNDMLLSPDFWRDNFHDYSEEDRKPGLSKKVVSNQAS